MFHPHARRRIVLATNVAETSLTVPGIHYVVDPGTARISRYSKATKVQRLPIEPISQARGQSTRRARGPPCGWHRDPALREDDFEGRPAFTEPEILRTSLASVLLQHDQRGRGVLARRRGDVPLRRAARHALDSRRRAICSPTSARSQTGQRRQDDADEVGRALAALPMDPRQARMIVEAGAHSAWRARWRSSPPRSRSRTRASGLGERARRRICSIGGSRTPSSDLLAYLNLWRYVARAAARALRKRVPAPVPRGIPQLPAHARVAGRGAADPHRRQAAQDRDAQVRRVARRGRDPRSMLAGLLSQIGAQDAGELKASSFSHLRGEARATAMRKARKQGNQRVPWRARRALRDQPGQRSRQEAARVRDGRGTRRDQHACGHATSPRSSPSGRSNSRATSPSARYSEPHWSKKRGAAVATERVLVYGVPIVADRTVLWGRINPAEARELFIRHALVEGEWETHHAFWAANQRALAEAEEVAARTRNLGALADDEALFAFYDDRIPADVISTRHFDTWWKQARRATPDLLTLTLDELLPGDHDTDGLPRHVDPRRRHAAADLRVLPRLHDGRGVRARAPRAPALPAARRLRLARARPAARPRDGDHSRAPQARAPAACPRARRCARHRRLAHAIISTWGGVPRRVRARGTGATRRGDPFRGMGRGRGASACALARDIPRGGRRSRGGRGSGS